MGLNNLKNLQADNIKTEEWKGLQARFDQASFKNH